VKLNTKLATIISSAETPRYYYTHSQFQRPVKTSGYNCERACAKTQPNADGHQICPSLLNSQDACSIGETKL